MSKHDNFQVNFSLKGFTNIQIGIYILIAAYFIKSILDGFLIDDNPLGMLSAELIEVFIIAIVFLTFLFSSLALFFSGRRKSKKFQFKLWNKVTKTAFYKYLTGFVFLIVVLIYLMKQGFIDYITPTFLILYGCILFMFKNKERKNLLVVSGICLLLAIYCILIPSYWYSSLFILGIAHVTYGIVVRN